HTVMPHAAIGCDILAGFPGEDKQAADRSYNLLADLPITYLHIFPYSVRPGTAAAKFPDQVPGPVKDARVASLQELDEQKRQAFYRQHCGAIQNVLFEGRDTQTGLLNGFTANYIPVCCRGDASLVGSVVAVQLLKKEDKGVFGKIIRSE
ncbi:MAG: tRNA (N(6)-L-threonylcarbamoyladenosine(37)-C(2))-methylthiotransferase MtaB, partial [Candidatus Electrothrix sp. MAN1_4]|nr:tRNA (N(6)-L-threonylcarbamoyladenosine(37)-C(2))-methylthiotransferase MtaB [Candidatus Electrothrix sp. MAN1_4]